MQENGSSRMPSCLSVPHFPCDCRPARMWKRSGTVFSRPGVVVYVAAISWMNPVPASRPDGSLSAKGKRCGKTVTGIFSVRDRERIMKRIPNCIQVTLILMDESGLVIQYAEMFTNPFLHEGLSVFPWIKLPKESKIADTAKISASPSWHGKSVSAPQAVQKWEKAKTVPRGATLRRLADVLGVSPAYIQFGITTSVSDTFSVEQETPDYVVAPAGKTG